MKPVSWKYRAECLGLLAVAAVVRALPRSAALACGRALGLCGRFLLPDRVRLARENMTRALPELSDQQLDETLKMHFQHLGCSVVEMLRLDMIASEQDLQRYFIIKDLAPLHRAVQRGRGVLLLTAHLGFWEAGTVVLPACGVPFDVVAKPLKNPLANHYFNRLRTAQGAEVLESRKGARRILKSLRRGRAVGVLLDQHISPPGSVVTEFFGQPAYTTSAIASMAMKHSIPIVPVFCLRRPDNRYEVWAESLVMFEPGDRDAVAANTQQLTSIIESAIRKDVSQWFWLHKRWRVKPKLAAPQE